MGDISDFSKPIYPDFHIERTIYSDIIKSFARGNYLVGVQGSAFSGKTSLLYQVFCRLGNTGRFFLYVDCYDHNYSIFKQLANSFSKSTKVLVTPDQIKEWILSSIHSSDENIFHLLLDNYNNNVSEVIKEEILELIDIFDHGNHKILYTIDEFNYEQISSISHRRQKTVIAQKTFVLELSEFDRIEYERAKKIMFSKYNFLIANGGQHAPEYRQPRILRYILAQHEDNIREEGRFNQLIAVPDNDLFNLFAQNESYQTSVHDLIKKISDCFIDEFNLQENNKGLYSSAGGNGSILIETFKRKYPNDYIELISSSIVVIRELPELEAQILYPKLPELVAYYCIPLISKQLVDKKNDSSLTNISDYFLKILERIPFSDIVGSAVLKELATSSPTLFSDLVQRYLEMPPRKEKISNNARLRLFLGDAKTMDLDYDPIKYGEGVFISDYMPYAILSQLGGYFMDFDHGAEESSNKVSYNFHLSFLYKIGSKGIIIPRVDFSLKNYDGYEWDGIDGFISSKEGIMEAIVQSIQKCFIAIPEEMFSLSKYAFEKKNFNFLYRYYLAVKDLKNIDDSKIAEKAIEFVREFSIFFNNFLNTTLKKEMRYSNWKVALHDNLKILDLKNELERFLAD